jgi:hypothetical protein
MACRFCDALSGVTVVAHAPTIERMGSLAFEVPPPQLHMIPPRHRVVADAYASSGED